MSDLIWIHTVCKGYQQTSLAGKELNVGMTFFMSRTYVFTSKVDFPSYLNENQT